MIVQRSIAVLLAVILISFACRNRAVELARQEAVALATSAPKEHKPAMEGSVQDTTNVGVPPVDDAYIYSSLIASLPWTMTRCCVRFVST